MFGFIRVASNIKEEDLKDYKSFYCGYCKNMKKYNNPALRLTTNYDITFFNMFLHSVLGIKAKTQIENCVLKPLKYSEISKETKITERVIDFNNILLFYKIEDDVIDKGNIKYKTLRNVFSKYYISSKNNEKYLDKIVKISYQRLRIIEKNKIKDYNVASEPFSEMLAKASTHLLSDKATEDIYNFMFNIGKYIYVIDAIKDIKEDFKNKNYNPFLIDEIDNIDKYIQLNKEKHKKILFCIYEEISKYFKNIKLLCYEGAITNIVWFGLLAVINQIIEGEKSE